MNLNLAEAKEIRIQKHIQQFEEMRKQSEVNTAIQIKKHRINTSLNQLPKIFKDKSFDDFRVDHAGQERIKAIAKKFVDTAHQRLGKNDLILSGKVKTGKTFLATLIAKYLIQKDFTVIYQPNLFFLRKFREKSFESHSSYEYLIKTYINTQFLIIDEAAESCVSNDTLSAWERNILFSIIDARYREGSCTTIVITNKPLDQASNILGQSISRRLFEKGLVLGFNWESYQE